MTIRAALDASIKSLTDALLVYVDALTSVHRTGKGAQLWTEYLRLYLSGREEKADYELTATITAIEAGAIAIHQARGTYDGIVADVKSICNQDTVTVQYTGPEGCGWVGDVTAPEFLGSSTYSPDMSLCYLDLDNMVQVTAVNKGNRPNAEVSKIIRHDFIPAKYNCQAFITK